MMTTHPPRHWRIWPIGILLAASSLGVMAQTSTSTTASSTTGATNTGTSEQGRLVGQYAPLAGSAGNARSLVTGLNTGNQVTLTSSQSGVPPASFSPATGKLGLGEVNTALALAKNALAQQGITNPTPAQLAAALNGGTVTNSQGKTVTMQGVLSARASGQGWGQIARSMGTTVGAVVSASKSANAKAGDDHTRTERSEKSESQTKEARGKEPAEAAKEHTTEAAGRVASGTDGAGGKSGAAGGHGEGRGGGSGAGGGNAGGGGGGGAGGGGGGGNGGGGGKR